MLNPLTLTQIVMLSMGMGANATMPLNMTKKESINITTERNEDSSSEEQYVSAYTLDVTPTYKSTTTFNNITVNDVGPYPYLNTATQYEDKYDISSSNPYLNVLGNVYSTWFLSRATNRTDAKIYQNLETYQNGLDTKIERMVYIYQITPYNFNVNTVWNIKSDLDIETFDVGPSEDWVVKVEDIKLLKNIYTTSSSTWAQYIDMTMVQDTGLNVINEITSLNNGYYYEKKTTITDVTNGRITDISNIPITPSVTNYVVIEYIPLVENSLLNDNIAESWEYQSACGHGNGLTIWSSVISGTNVIPNGTYEVVDIAGIMWEILTMPFAFVSQAFNLTLFPNTPYQINISNLFLSIIAIVAFVTILSIIFKVKGMI